MKMLVAGILVVLSEAGAVLAKVLPAAEWHLLPMTAVAIPCTTV